MTRQAIIENGLLSGWRGRLGAPDRSHAIIYINDVLN
jgi:hypothetical protein